MDTPPYDQPQENTGGHPQKRKRNRPRGSRMKSKVHLINDRSTFKPKYYDCECDDCDSYIKQKNARNMRKAILLSKRISARSQASPQQTRIIRHTRTKKRDKGSTSQTNENPIVTCTKCGALMWTSESTGTDFKTGEPTFTVCCNHGQIRLPPINQPLTLL
ncbi:PREDICTED: uncharacterized protein LOC106321452 isoform X2 [Brassica oleracea var. oleracea]|uniref:uncharacterized protein LOC106321452 isoform X2 n=1 Tax=Brassica oleracea var. oleracea TaxID=109376 RepID=UPI0006A72D1C|nr:PREDICTED: uncharacterized protein LOC106321452 isoform X2 [Brassica oleracea var. oleracea]